MQQSSQQIINIEGQPAELIENLKGRDFASEKIEESVVDYVLRCSKGIYKGFYVYLNVTFAGEILGSAEEKDITLRIDDADLAPRHASIRLEVDEETNRICYVLRDLKSGHPTWVKIRYDIPVVVKQNMEIKIGKKIYVLRMSEEEVTDTPTPDDAPDCYIKQKLEVVDQKTNKVELLVGWGGANISSKAYVYQKPPDILLNRQDFDDYEEDPCFELMIRYLYGKYILWSWRTDNFNVFFRVDEYHTLIPDDTIKLGNLEMTVQRFNTGVWLDQGKRQTMEDAVSLVQDLGVSSRVPVSCFGVFDGHHGDECVTYISSHLFENLRENILKSEPQFDQQQLFYQYALQLFKSTFKFTDYEFFQEYQQDKAIHSGCVCAICVIFGDLIVSANVGDCRAILSRQGKAVPLTVDHKPDNPKEKARIERKGGQVNGCRVDQLSVSRAFGDFNLKKEKHKTGKNLINCKPDVRVHQIDYRKDEFIVLCSDGVLEGFQSDQKLIDFIRERYRNTKIMEQDPQQMAKEVLQFTYQTVLQQKNLTDNLSLIIVNLTRGVNPVEERLSTSN